MPFPERAGGYGGARVCTGGIIIAYGYPPTRSVLRGRRAAQLPQAAEQLGVTQPAVSLQIRSLEKRLGLQLLDRSGRRVEPTEAGHRLYRSAQRLLALEEQLLQARRGGGGRPERPARDRRVDRAGRDGAAGAPRAVPAAAPGRPRCALRVRHAACGRAGRAARLELGVVEAVRRHRGVVFEPFFRDEVVLACPPAPVANRTVTLDELKAEPLVLMQEGAGVRQ